MPTEPTVTDSFAQLRADVDTLEAQVNAAAPMTRPTGTVTIAGTTVPYVPIETLGFGPGDDPNRIVAAMRSPGVLTFPPGIFPITGFSTGYVTGFNIPHGPSVGTNGYCFGIVGSGPGSLDRGRYGTYFVLLSGTSRLSSASSITNAYVMKAADVLSLKLGQFRVCGSDQGHLFSCLSLYHAEQPCQVDDVAYDGWAGNANVPPGETAGFTIIDKGDGKRRDHIVNRLEGDGRRMGGQMTGTAPLGGQNMNGSIWNDCYGHDCIASQAGWFQSRNVTTNRLRVARNGTGTGTKSGQGINHEQTSGIVHNQPIIDIPRANGNTGTHISHSNYDGTSPFAPGLLTINDPQTFIDGQPAPLVAQSWAPYVASNTAAPVVNVGGKPITIQWSH